MKETSYECIKDWAMIEKGERISISENPWPIGKRTVWNLQVIPELTDAELKDNFKEVPLRGGYES